jgi:hypothetical protein
MVSSFHIQSFITPGMNYISGDHKHLSTSQNLHFLQTLRNENTLKKKLFHIFQVFLDTASWKQTSFEDLV